MRKAFIVTLMIISSMISAELLRLSEAQELAIRQNPELRAAESEMLSARKSKQSSFLGIIPSASINYSKTHFNPDAGQGLVTYDWATSYGISASQPIFNGGKIILGMQIAENAYRIKEASYQSKLLEIMANTETKYFAVQSNLEMVKAREKSLEQSSINLETAKVKKESGLISNAEYLQLESEKLSSELELINMRNALELSKLDIANYIGLASEFEVEEFKLTEYEEVLNSLQMMTLVQQKEITARLLELGKELSPTLKISSFGVSSSKQAKLMAAGNFLPSINLGYSYNWQGNNTEDEINGSSTLSLSASMPIFPLADNALDYKAASYNQKSSEHNHQATENSILLAIRSSCLNLYTSARAVESAKLSNKSAWESWDQMRERFEQGLASSSELLNAEVMVISSDNNYISAKQEFLKSISSLVQLTGLPDKKELIKMILNEEE